MNKRLTQLVSRLFDPTLEIPLAILFAVYIAVSEGVRWRFLGILLFIDLVVPLIFFLTMLYHKQIKDWDVRERRERLPLYFFTMLCHLGGVWLARELGRVELAQLLFIFWGMGLIFAGVTVFWKISIHGGVNAFLITLINYFYDWTLLWLYIVLFLVGWARVRDKHHTLWQYVAGCVLGALGLLVGLNSLVGGS